MKFTNEEFEELYSNLKINISKIQHGCERKLWGKSWTEEHRQRCLKRRDFLLSLKDKFDQESEGRKL
tara:strand:+ start:307 stop:507 length:201 start_codon:yes stop_codon:yes gene_type:complete